MSDKRVETFTREAGAGYSQSVEDPAMRLLGDPVPEWVDLPADLGGGRRVVTGHAQITCPCGTHPTRELHLGTPPQRVDAGALVGSLRAEDNLKTLCVAECPGQGFLWYLRRIDSDRGAHDGA